MCEYSEILLEESLTQASSIFVLVDSLGSFLASFSVGVIAEVSGNSSPRFPLLIGIIVIIVIGLVWSIYEVTKNRLPAANAI